MLIANQKLQENIAEYVLYMFQIEDIVRGFELNLDVMLEKFVYPSLPNPSFANQYKIWYSEIVREVKNNGLEKEGHLERVHEVLMELVYLHNTLLTVIKDAKYLTLTEDSTDVLNEFRDKSGLKNRHDVEVLFHAMYMKLQLKIRKQEISPETEAAMDKMRIQLAYLSREYIRMKSGEWQMNMN